MWENIIDSLDADSSLPGKDVQDQEQNDGILFLGFHFINFSEFWEFIKDLFLQTGSYNSI